MKIKQFAREIFAQVKRDWYMPVTEHQVYDTTERVIGTYMGKPLYRKSYKYNSPIVVSYGTWVSVQDVANLNIEHCDIRIDGVYSADVLYCGELSKLDVLQYGVANNTVMAYMLKYGSVSVSITDITIEYTKTTDTASESKVPFEPLTEYSTEERMIGYWIDGKPLYRKVLTGNATGSSAYSGFFAIGKRADLFPDI